MGDLIIKPNTGGELKLQEDGGTDAIAINTSGGVSGTAIKDEDDMSTDSATHLATQQSIKAYADANSTADQAFTAGRVGGATTAAQSLGTGDSPTFAGATINGYTVQNGVHTFTTSFRQRLDLNNYWDVTVPDETNFILIQCGIGYYPGGDYCTSHYGWYGFRGSTNNFGLVTDIATQSSSNAGSWSAAEQDDTTIRITKVDGAASASGSGFIKVTFKGTTG